MLFTATQTEHFHTTQNHKISVSNYLEYLHREWKQVESDKRHLAGIRQEDKKLSILQSPEKDRSELVCEYHKIIKQFVKKSL